MSYLVDFYVTSPAPLSVTGDMQSSILNGTFVDPYAETIFSLATSVSAAPLYQIIANPLAGVFVYPVETIDKPLSYQGWLEPGQTYTLSVGAESTDMFYGCNNYPDQDAGSFTFTATVPEPTGILLPAAAFALTMRCRRTQSRLSGRT